MPAVLVMLTIFLPWLGAVAVWAAGWGRQPQPAARWQNYLAVGFSLVTAVAALALIPFNSPQAVISIPMGDFFGQLSFTADALGIFLAAIAAVIGCLAVIFSVDYMHGDPQLGRYYVLVLLFIGGMAGLVLTDSLLFLFAFWEVTALCSYALISYYNDDPKAVAGGIKALIITQIGGIGLLAGALIAYANTGSLQISEFLAGAGKLPAGVLSVMAFGFLIAAAAKSAQVPFHTWLPDAMEAPTPISALIHAATMVNAGVYLLARFYPAFAEAPYWRSAVLTVGAVTALLAAVMACVAFDLKRVLAYSTVSQLGYMVYAIGAGSVFASQFHLFSHAIFKALLFLGAGAIIHTVETRDMRRMGRPVVKMPFVRLVFITGALALAGIPIFNGFWSKELVLEAGLEGGPLWAFAVMVLGAGLTAYYTLRMVWMVFYQETPVEQRSSAHIHDAPMAMRVALAPLAVAVPLTWLLAGYFWSWLQAGLPFHALESETTVHMVVAVLSAPATWLALAVVGLGLAAFVWRARLGGLALALAPLARLAEAGFGFEHLNRWVVDAAFGTAAELRRLQTGRLNWNLMGVIGGLLCFLVWLVWSV